MYMGQHRLDVVSIYNWSYRKVCRMKTITVELKNADHDILAQKVEDYFGGWHPFAYGTRLVRPAYYDEDQQCWVAVITRQTSCD